MNQNLSNLTDIAQSTSALSDPSKKPETPKLLSQKRDEYLENSRSQKIKLLLQTKRLTAVKAISDEVKLGQGPSIQEFIAECEKQTYTLGQISELVTSLCSENLCRQYFGVIGIRKLLATQAPPIQPIIDAGVIPRLIEFLGKEDQHQLQVEAAWVLANLSSGTTEQTQKIAENGAIPALIKLLRSPHRDVKFKALWPFGNFAGDCVNFRDMILKGGAISLLVEILDKAISEKDQYMIRDGNWALRNLCRAKPLPLFEDIKEILPVIAKVIMSQEDSEILNDAVWCISYISSEGKEERIQEVIDTGVVPYIVKLMDKGDFSILDGCLRTIGNICLGNNEQVDVLLSIPGIMEKVFSALESRKKAVRKDAALVVANIMARTPECIVRDPGYLEKILHIGRTDIPEVRKEVAVALKDALNCTSQEQMRILLVEMEIFMFFGNLIQEKEESLQEVGLEGMYNILILRAERVPEGFSKAACLSWLEENNLLPVIEKLGQNDNIRILKFACRILGAWDQEKLKNKGTE